MSIKIYKDIEQGSPEWFALRVGKMTASNATAIGANGAGLKTYAKDIAMQIVGVEIESYTNADMDRGNELEEFGSMAYELERDVTVEKVAFVTNNDFTDTGASPDGLVGKDGGIEIKARNDKKHFALLMGETKEIPFNQIQFTLMITGRKWWDFVSINPNFSKPLFIARILPDEKTFKKFEAGLTEGRKLIKEYKDLYSKFKN